MLTALGSPAGMAHHQPVDGEACVRVLELMRSLAATSYGPMGRSKIVQPRAGSGTLTVTSMSHRLFGELQLEHPVARVLLQMLAGRQVRGADGGLFTVMLACSLVLGAKRQRLPARSCVSLLRGLLTESLHAVLEGRDASGGTTGLVSGRPAGRCGRPWPPTPAAAVPLRMHDLPSLLSAVRSVLRPKHVGMPHMATAATRRAEDGSGASACDELALLVVRGFVESIPAYSAPTASATRSGHLTHDLLLTPWRLLDERPPGLRVCRACRCHPAYPTPCL